MGDETLLLSTPAGYATPKQVDAVRQYAKSLLEENTKPQQIGHWTQGMGRVVGALMGGAQLHHTGLVDRASDLYDANRLPRDVGDTTHSASEPPAVPRSEALTAPKISLGPDAGPNVIAGMESGGRGNYKAVGPVNPKTGDRPYGKHQVMGKNIPEWTQQILGHSMTPEEFLADEEAQDEVAKAKFAEYTKKYGPEGAARAWFAGEQGMNNPNAKDVLGTSVADYSRKFVDRAGLPSSMAFTGEPAGPGGDAPNAPTAIVRALAGKGGMGAAPPVPGMPAASHTPGAVGGDAGALIPPGLTPHRTPVSREEFVNTMASQRLSPEAKAAVMQAYFGQRQPLEMQTTGGRVVINPLNPSQQRYIPDLQKGTFEGVGGTKFPFPWAIGPNGEFKTFDSGPGGSIPGSAGPGNRPATAPITKEDAGLGGFFGNPAPGASKFAPEDTPNDPIGKALNLAPDGSPAAGPGGGSGGAPNTKVAQVPDYARRLNDWSMDQGVEFDARKKYAEKDMESFAKQRDLIQDVGKRAQASMPSLQLAKQMVADPNFVNGLFAGPHLDFQRLKSLVGINPQAAAANQVFDKIISGQIVEDMKIMLQGLGQVRVAEIDLLTRATASMYMDKPAINAVLEIQSRAHQQASNIAKITNAYERGLRFGPDGKPYQTNERPTTAGLQNLISRYQENNPLFSPEEIKKYNETFDKSKVAGADDRKAIWSIAHKTTPPKAPNTAAVKKTYEAAAGLGPADATSTAPYKPAAPAKGPKTYDELPPGYSVKE